MSVSYYEDKSNLNPTEFFNKIYNSSNVLEARNVLAQEVKIAAIKLLAGEGITEWYDINNFQEISWKDVIPDQKIYYVSGDLKDGNPTRVYGPHSIYDPIKRILVGKNKQKFYERWHCVYIQKGE